MMNVTVSPPNSLVLVVDPASGDLPEDLSDGPVTATTSALVIGTRSSDDGQTHISMNDAAPVEPGLTNRWTGKIAVSSRIAVTTVLLDILLERAAEGEVSVEVWSDDPVEPAMIWLVVE